MSHPPFPIGRGLCLLSGGLDSRLAIAVLREQGLYVEAVVFESPFFNSAPARQAAEVLQVPLHAADFTADILALLKSPPHGFGSCLNPCIDCHARMLNRAGEMMERMGFDFLATGEVLNQRPMSQNRRALGTVLRDSAYGDRIVRPLSAQLLEPSLPEQRGIVDRTRLLKLSGRSRHAQMELARHYGIRDYPAPAGGCLLTEPGFCVRLKDLMEHEGLDERRRVRLLKGGRCFRLPGGAACLAGRDQADNAALAAEAKPGDIIVASLEDVPGPTVLLPGGAAEADLALACGICASYTDRGSNGPEEPITVRVMRDGAVERRAVVPLPRAQSDAWLKHRPAAASGARCGA